MNGKGTVTAKPLGVKNLELRYMPMFDPYTRKISGYRTSTVIYSGSLGTLSEKDYTYAADFGNSTGVRLSLWNIGEALRHIKKAEESGINPGTVTAHCTSSFAASENAYEAVKKVLAKSGVKDVTKLCLEFPQSVLYLLGDGARKTVLDMKLLGLKTMISGIGSADCPVSKLLTVPADYAMLEEGTTALIRDRNKPGVLQKFVQYLRSMNFTVIADGAESDEDIRELASMGCFAVVLSKDYQGKIENTDGDLTFNEAMSIKELTDGK